MPFPNWDTNEIRNLKDLTVRVGRPLEVNTAATLATQGWTVHLNTYYIDVFSKKARELDVLAHKRVGFNSRDHLFDLDLYLYISCKGFTEHQYPVAWSVVNDRAANLDQFLCTSTGLNRGFADRLGQSAATALVVNTGLEANQRMLGMRVCEQDKKGGFSVVRDRDNELYEGADSALKAARWAGQDTPFSGIQVHVPIVLLDRRLTNMLIDHGRINDPEPRPGGYLTGLHPLSDNPAWSRWLLTLVWSAQDLPLLIKALDASLGYMCVSFAAMNLNPP